MTDGPNSVNRKGPKKHVTVVGRFWKDTGESKNSTSEVCTGYVELGIFGKVRCTLSKSPKRTGYENYDSDYTLAVDNQETPFGILRYLRHNVEDALFDSEPINPPEVI